MHKQLIISEAHHKQRLDQAIAQLWSDYSREQIKQWIKAGNVCIDGTPCTQPRQKVLTDQCVDIQAEAKTQGEWEAEAIPLNIVYQDDDILVVNKPAGLVVHPGAGTPNGTLLNALLYFDESLRAIPRAGIVHRLDKDTTGLLVIARTLTAHHKLTAMLAAREIEREYEALVYGVMVVGGKINAPIGRHGTHRTKMAVTHSGKSALTTYRILEKFPFHTHLRLKLSTGRTHQIRVHLTHINYPLVGDHVYKKQRGKSIQAIDRQTLHAKRLGLHHPVTGEWLEWEVELPEDFQAALAEAKTFA